MVVVAGMSEDRLFVALNTRPYRDFERGAKTWELRGVNDQFNRDTVYPGRLAELRRGYSTDDSLWGQITAVETFSMLSEIPVRIDHETIQPGATHTEFLDTVASLLGDYDEWIAFRVPETQPRKPRRCTGCGKVIQERDAPYVCWLFSTCHSCAVEPAPDRWGDGSIGPGTYRKWRYFPRWHMTEHPETPKRVATDGGMAPQPDAERPLDWLRNPHNFWAALLVCHLAEQDLQARSGNSVYTPKEITDFMAEQAIEQKALDDLNEATGADYASVGEVFGHE